jgi:hypothetical protein
MTTVAVTVTARGGDQRTHGVDEDACTAHGTGEASCRARGADKAACTAPVADEAACTVRGAGEAARTHSSEGGSIPSLPHLPMTTVVRERGADSNSDSDSETLTVKDYYVQDDEDSVCRDSFYSVCASCSCGIVSC